MAKRIPSPARVAKEQGGSEVKKRGPLKEKMRESKRRRRNKKREKGVCKRSCSRRFPVKEIGSGD